MDAVEILKKILQDGYLSDRNKSLAVDFFAEIERREAAPDHSALLESCRIEAKSGDAIQAIKRYREKSGCSLREAKYAVLGY